MMLVYMCARWGKMIQRLVFTCAAGSSVEVDLETALNSYLPVLVGLATGGEISSEFFRLCLCLCLFIYIIYIIKKKTMKRSTPMIIIINLRNNHSWLRHWNFSFVLVIICGISSLGLPGGLYKVLAL